MFENWKKRREERKAKRTPKLHLSTEFWQELGELGAMIAIALVDRELDASERKALWAQVSLVGQILLSAPEEPPAAQ